MENKMETTIMGSVGLYKARSIYFCIYILLVVHVCNKSVELSSYRSNWKRKCKLLVRV